MKLNHLTIEKIEIKQFKKIRDLAVTPDEKGNLLYGTFRSGKTSLCEFIQFALYGADSVSLARGNAEDAEGKITECLNKAMELLDISEYQNDGNYAFVCEKCASVFGYYGYFAYENELTNRNRRIYEGA